MKFAYLITMDSPRWVVDAFTMMLVPPHKHKVFKIYKNKVLVLPTESPRKDLQSWKTPPTLCSEMDFVLSNGTKMLSQKLVLIEIKSENSSVIRCNQEGGHSHLTNPLSLQVNSSLAQGVFLGLILLGLGAMKFKMMWRVSPIKWFWEALGCKIVVGGLDINVFSLGIWSQCNNFRGD